MYARGGERIKGDYIDIMGGNALAIDFQCMKKAHLIKSKNYLQKQSNKQTIELK